MNERGIALSGDVFTDSRELVMRAARCMGWTLQIGHFGVLEYNRGGVDLSFGPLRREPARGPNHYFSARIGGTLDEVRALVQKLAAVLAESGIPHELWIMMDDGSEEYITALPPFQGRIAVSGDVFTVSQELVTRAAQSMGWALEPSGFAMLEYGGGGVSVWFARGPAMRQSYGFRARIEGTVDEVRAVVQKLAAVLAQLGIPHRLEMGLDGSKESITSLPP